MGSSRPVLSRLPVCSALRMAEKSEDDTAAISPGAIRSDSGQDPEIFGRHRDEEGQGEKKEEKDTEGGGGEGKGEEAAAVEAEAEVFRPAKRRKNCPAALEKSLSSNRGFSFTFDTKVAANGPIESTPKFGSFIHSDGIGSGRALGLQDEEGKKKEAVEAREEVDSGEGQGV